MEYVPPISGFCFSKSLPTSLPQGLCTYPSLHLNVFIFLFAFTSVSKLTSRWGDKPGQTSVGPSILNLIDKDYILSWVFLSSCLPAWAEVCSCIRKTSANLRERQWAQPTHQRWEKMRQSWVTLVPKRRTVCSDLEAGHSHMQIVFIEHLLCAWHC